MTKDSPARSCYQIHQCNPKAPSQSYWLETEEGQITAIRPVYCNMDNRHSGSKGWTRVAYINMTEDGATCPETLRLIISPKKLCTRTTGGGASCSSVTLSTHGMKYNKVCGQAVGYQGGSTDSYNGKNNINSYYVDGMSITYGSPRKHIWTYAVGLSDNYDFNGVQGILEYMITPLFISMTLCGMERVVVLITTAVHNLECPGSVVLYHRKWRGTLKYVCVQIKPPMMKNCTWSS